MLHCESNTPDSQSFIFHIVVCEDGKVIQAELCVSTLLVAVGSEGTGVGL